MYVWAPPQQPRPRALLSGENHSGHLLYTLPEIFYALSRTVLFHLTCPEDGFNRHREIHPTMKHMVLNRFLYILSCSLTRESVYAGKTCGHGIAP